MKSLTSVFTLKNGVGIPCVGLGTWQTPNGDVAVAAVKEALACGYRHIDTAFGYQNEESVGRGLVESGIPRDEVFITTKLTNEMHGYEATRKGFEISMDKLGLDYLDLYLIHWPNPVMFRDNWAEMNAGSWKAFEELYDAGRIRSIGVSNFHGHHIDALLEKAKHPPMVNQIRLCPGDTQDDVVNYCRRHDILLEAYSPLGTGEVFTVPVMRSLAEKYDKTIAQICLRWSLQMGFLPLPKSVGGERIRENADIFDFELAPEDVKLLAGLKGCCGYSQDPDSVEF